MQQLLADLAAEQDDLDRLVADLPESDWDRPTPAEGWTIRDQISHLAYFDERATLAARDAKGFEAAVSAELSGSDPMTRHLERGRALSAKDLLDWWRRSRQELRDTMAKVEPDTRLPWYGPPMRASSSVVARLMETWAHGDDVATTLDVERDPTDRLFHIAELGVKTFRFAFDNRGLTVPTDRVRVALRGSSGVVRVWNDEFDDSVTGPLEEFCLVVAQRVHPADTHLVIEGPTARNWMEIAQVFAGPPGPGRPSNGLLAQPS